MNDDVVAEIQAMIDRVAVSPPVPRAIVADHRVPYGRAYRLWNTRAELLIYANRGEVEDCPAASRRTTCVTELCPPGVLGIPVRNA